MGRPDGDAPVRSPDAARDQPPRRAVESRAVEIRAVEVRRADGDDAATIARILAGSFASLRELYTPAAFDETIGSPETVLERLDEGPVWIASIGDEPAGTLSALPTAGGLYLRGMAVLPRFRGRGVGRRLLEVAARYAVGRSCDRLLLSTTPFLHAATALYESFGFRRVRRGPADLHGTRLVSMEMALPGGPTSDRPGAGDGYPPSAAPRSSW